MKHLKNICFPWLQVVGLRDVLRFHGDGRHQEGAAVCDPALGGTVEGGSLVGGVLKLRVPRGVQVDLWDFEGDSSRSSVEPAVRCRHPAWKCLH